MRGIFLRPSGTGWETIKIDGGTFPMDYHRHRTIALSYAKRIGREQGLPVFEEIQG